VGNHLISLMILIPLLGALIQAFLPEVTAIPRAKLGKWSAVAASILSGICGLILVLTMSTQAPGPQHVETLPWIGSYAINYEVAVDGLNALLVLLFSLLFPVVLAAEWEQKLGPRGKHGLFLLLQSALLGAVCAQDLFLQFFFWAFTAFPLYFLVGIWGGKDRESAAFRAIVTASVGNALLFSALVLIYYSVDPHTFLLRELAGGKLNGKTV
jgi:NADH-quinone oxidoreductase subunit M